MTSTILTKFAETDPEVLTNPEKYLGPNWRDVLNFWIYIDTLSDLEKREIADRYLVLDSDARDSAEDVANDAAEDVVGEEFGDGAWWAAYDVSGKCHIFGYATEELIGSHKLLEQGNPPTFLPLCVNN